MTARTCETCGQPLEHSPIGKVDWAEFGLALRLEMARQNISYRGLADMIGVDQATIHRAAKHGKPIRVESYLALSAFIQPTTQDTQP